MRILLRILLALFSLLHCAHSFFTNKLPSVSFVARRQQQQLLPMTKQEIAPTTDTEIPSETTTLVLTVTLSEHRPLGCTVEESLAGGGHVFVTKLSANSNAANAGLQLGDVITGVTGLFGEIEDVTGLGIDKVKSLVASRPDDEVLELTILRGSNVAAQHEAAVVELCSNPDADDSVDQCVLEYLQGGYNVDDDDDSSSTSSTSSTLDEDANEGDILCDTEDDGDCLVDDLHNLWANDLPVQPTAAADGTTAIETDKNDDNDEPAAIKPWSSRASPSGTYVRDPVTGEMKNID